MNLNALRKAAQKVINTIDSLEIEDCLEDILASIKGQMAFIRDSASKGLNPSEVLPPNTTFTYAILASRELESPDELILQHLIDDVTKELLRVSKF